MPAFTSVKTSKSSPVFQNAKQEWFCGLPIQSSTMMVGGAKI